jgi:hypothetical protein
MFQTKLKGKQQVRKRKISEVQGELALTKSWRDISREEKEKVRKERCS